MTDADIDLIERELAITLPAAYRQAVVPFRIPALAGNTEERLWDDAHALIRLNREMRTGSKWCPPWPEYYYAIGDPHGDELHALDLRTPEGAVWELDHGNVDSADSFQSHERFSDWVEEFYQEQLDSLMEDGIAPEASPEELDKARRTNANKSCLGCLAISIVIGLLAGLCIGLFKYHFGS